MALFSAGSTTSVVGAAVGTFVLVILLFRELARPAAFSGRHSIRLAVLPRFRFVRLRRLPRPA
jgi:hypothetical protein